MAESALVQIMCAFLGRRAPCLRMCHTVMGAAEEGQAAPSAAPEGRYGEPRPRGGPAAPAPQSPRPRREGLSASASSCVGKEVKGVAKSQASRKKQTRGMEKNCSSPSLSPSSFSSLSPIKKSLGVAGISKASRSRNGWGGFPLPATGTGTSDRLKPGSVLIIR